MQKVRQTIRNSRRKGAPDRNVPLLVNAQVRHYGIQLGKVRLPVFPDRRADADKDQVRRCYLVYMLHNANAARRPAKRFGQAGLGDRHATRRQLSESFRRALDERNLVAAGIREAHARYKSYVPGTDYRNVHGRRLAQGQKPWRR